MVMMSKATIFCGCKVLPSSTKNVHIYMAIMAKASKDPSVASTVPSEATVIGLEQFVRVPDMILQSSQPLDQR